MVEIVGASMVYRCSEATRYLRVCVEMQENNENKSARSETRKQQYDT